MSVRNGDRWPGRDDSRPLGVLVSELDGESVAVTEVPDRRDARAKEAARSFRQVGVGRIGCCLHRVASGVEDEVDVAVDQAGQDGAARERAALGGGGGDSFDGCAGPDCADGAVLEEHGSVVDPAAGRAGEDLVGGEKLLSHGGGRFRREGAAGTRRSAA
nr:hypothetical protein [Amycolatopsis balhimycina]